MIIAAMVIWMYILDLIQGENIDYYTVFAPSIKAWVTKKDSFPTLQELKRSNSRNTSTKILSFMELSNIYRHLVMSVYSSTLCNVSLWGWRHRAQRSVPRPVAADARDGDALVE